MTKTAAGALATSNLRPSCSCIAVESAGGALGSSVDGGLKPPMASNCDSSGVRLGCRLFFRFFVQPFPRSTLLFAQAGSSRGKLRPVDDILRRSDQAAPDCKPTIFYFPKSSDASFYVRVRCPYDPHAVGLTYIYVDPPTARTTLVDRFYQEPSGMRIVRLMTPIHYGDVGGPSTRILWIFIGVAPSILSSQVC
jgi:uncharacterized iron-regulated membrane protein